MKIIYKEGEGEIEEKKSRFIAHVYPVQSEEQADRKSTRLNSSHANESRMPSSA